MLTALLKKQQTNALNLENYGLPLYHLRDACQAQAKQSIQSAQFQTYKAQYRDWLFRCAEVCFALLFIKTPWRGLLEQQQVRWVRESWQARTAATHFYALAQEYVYLASWAELHLTLRQHSLALSQEENCLLAESLLLSLQKQRAALDISATTLLTSCLIPPAPLVVAETVH
jgi:hypothetical protein